MEKFKFFNQNVLTNNMWDDLGALDGAANRQELDRVLNITKDYMDEHNIDNVYLIPIMIRLFYDKNNEYNRNLIITYIVDIINDVNDMYPSLRDNHLNSTGIDWETEMCAIIAERYYWYEREDNQILRNNGNF
jgi:hypothetical protein